MKKAIIAFFIIFVLMISLGACTKATAPAPFKITLVTPDNSPLWSRVDAGCQKALTEIGIHKIEYTWLYPGMEISSDDAGEDAAKLETVNDTIAQALKNEVDVLILADDDSAFSSAVDDAINQGVRFISLHSAALMPTSPSADVLTTIELDEKEAGKYAGEQLISALAAKEITSGTIGVCDLSIDSSDDVDSGINKLRLEGFLEAFDEQDHFTVKTMPKSSYAGAVALFGTCEADMLYIAEALKNSSKTPVISGFGGIGTEILDLIDDDTIASSIVPDYENIGYLALKTSYAALTGGAAPDTLIDPRALSITKTNSSVFRPADNT